MIEVHAPDVTVGGRVILRLAHDFGAGLNAGGFHEVVVPEYLALMVHPGDVIDFGDRELTVRGRIRCVVVRELPS